MKYVIAVLGAAALVLVGIVGSRGPLPLHGPQHMGMHGGMRDMMMRRPSTVPASAPAALGRFACSSCHVSQGVGVGPRFSWIAWRYRGRPEAIESVTRFVEHGGKGPWGGTMPDLGVPPEQARELAQWILSRPPEAPPNPAAIEPK
jgi:cytochrome c551/c552